MTTSGRGTDTSSELTEVRTVLSRAESAKAKISARPGSWIVTSGHDQLDPDRAEMIAALDAVIEVLDRWRRQGR